MAYYCLQKRLGGTIAQTHIQLVWVILFVYKIDGKALSNENVVWFVAITLYAFDLQWPRGVLLSSKRTFDAFRLCHVLCTVYPKWPAGMKFHRQCAVRTLNKPVRETNVQRPPVLDRWPSAGSFGLYLQAEIVHTLPIYTSHSICKTNKYSYCLENWISAFTHTATHTLTLTHALSPISATSRKIAHQTSCIPVRAACRSKILL